MPFFDGVIDFVQRDVHRAIENEAAQKVLENPALGMMVSKWSNLAPTLPPGALISLGSSNIDPSGDLGQWLIKSALPVVMSGRDRGGNPMSQEDQQATYGLLSDPTRLDQLQHLNVDEQTNIFKHAARHVAALNEQQIGNVAQSGNLPGGGGGILSDVTGALGTAAGAVGGAIGDVAGSIQGVNRQVSSLPGQATAQATGQKPVPQEAGFGQGDVGNVTRPAFAALSAPAELIQAEQRQLAGEMSGSPINKALPYKPEYQNQPSLQNLGSQITAVQALQGKDLGKGIFPGGEAQQAAVAAQQRTASIDGHALTPGRAVAANVFQPGSHPYAVMSGLIDGAVALKTDPASIALSELGAVNEARRTFSTTTENAIQDAATHITDKISPGNAAAIRDWAGYGKYQGAIAQRSGTITDAIAQKLRENPGALQELEAKGIVNHADVVKAIAGRDAGLISGLRNSVHGPTSLQWLNGPGRDFVGFAAKNNGLTIYEKTGGKIPVPVAWQLGEATDENKVRQILADHIGNDIRDVPYGWQHSWNDIRMANQMPNYAVDGTDPAMRTQRAMQELKLGGVPKAEWDNLLRPIALDPTGSAVVDSYKKVGNRIGERILEKTPGYQKDAAQLKDMQAELERTGVEPPGYRQLLGNVNTAKQYAREHTTYFLKRSNEDRQWWLDEMGNTPVVRGFALDGSPTAITGPYMVSEFLNRSVPVLGGDGVNGLREIRRAVSTFAPFYRNPITGSSFKGLTYVMDHITQIFKVGALAKLALPVRFLADEQARGATAGFDTMLKNPMSNISWVLNHKGDADLLTDKGTAFADQIADHQSAMSRAVGRGSNIKEELSKNEQVFTKGWGSFERGDPNHVTAWGDRLGAAHVDQISRATARAIVDPAGTGGLDAVKQAVWDGALQARREDIIAAKPFQGAENLIRREQSDAYVDGMVQRLHDFTAGGNPALMQAVATGGEFASGRASPRLLKGLRELASQGYGPKVVTGPIPFEGGQVGAMRKATNIMFSLLMDTPTTTLTRSPIFRQAYFKRMEELLPYVSDEDRALLIQRAGRQGIRFQPGVVASATGEPWTIEHADTVAKAYGLKTTHDFLYYPGERTNRVDILRNIYPFGNAWKNVLTKWAKLTAEHPQVVRRVQQGVTDARSSGWWFTDPQDGQEKFTLVPGEGMKFLTGIDTPMVASVRGLNVVGAGMPGVGPTVSVAASLMLSQIHSVPFEDFVRKQLLPYGDPDFSGGTMEQFFPGWWDKVRTAGYAMKGNVPFLSQSGDERRILDNTAKQAFATLASSGTFDLKDPNVLNMLWKKSTNAARKLYLWRGLAQAVSPSAPSYIPQTQLRDGSMIETWLVAQDYQKMIKDAGGDTNTATLAFVKKYGVERVFSTQPMTQLKTAFALPTTAEAEVWQTQHSDFARTYPNLFGYWAPQGGSFDYQAYLDEIHNGTREPLSIEKWTRLAEARVGNSLYDQQRRKVPSSPNAAQRDWLNQWKATYTNEFKGFNDDSLKVSKETTAQSIEQLKSAVNDSAVEGTPLAKAAGQYLMFRDRALEEAKRRGYTTLSGNSVADLRDWLFQKGTVLANNTPEFTNMWNYMFQHEVDPNV